MEYKRRDHYIQHQSLLVITPYDWSDYTLLDAGDGEKLERWGKYLLSRPDPQAIWHKKKKDIWRNIDAVYHRSDKGGGEWEYFTDIPLTWHIKYKSYTFIVRPTNFKHTGVFPEQAVNWDWMADRIKSSGVRVKILNLFAYTGCATTVCASSGAFVTHVDASKGMIKWARENRTLNKLSDNSSRYIVDDVSKFVNREIKRGVIYDAVIMDPPAYGRGANGEMWKIEDDLHDLILACKSILSDKPLFFLLNSYASNLSPMALQNILSSVFSADVFSHTDAGEITLPIDSGGFLPCGVYVRLFN
jgi:23S rRNA (cytosine1962-C5)-methyltransferase